MLSGCSSSKQSPEDEARAAFDDVRDAVRAIVIDPDRAAQAVALVNEMEQNFQQASADVDARRATFQELFSNYDTPEAELEAVLVKMRETMRNNRQKIGDTRERLAEILTDAEWEALQKERSKALDKAVAAVFAS